MAGNRRRHATPARQSIPAASLTKPARREDISAPRRPVATHCLLAACLAVLTVAVYAPVRHFQFVTYDDPAYIIGNPAVAAGLTWSGVRWAWENAYLGTGGPLTWLSHMTDVQLFGLDAGWHHVISLAWHIVNTLLLYGLLTRMTGRITRSALVAALFALHPLHVESVAWIAERKDVLSAFFWLLAMWAYLSYARRPRAVAYAAVLTFHACGLLAKPMVATLPFVLLLMDVWPLRRWPAVPPKRPAVGRLIVEKLPLLGLSVLSLWAVLRAQQSIGAVDYGAVPMPGRLANAIVSYVAYLWKFLWPAGLVPHYPYEPFISAWQVVACLILLAALTAVALLFVRRVPAVAVGWAWYLGTLVPVIGLVQVGAHRMADRFTYLPSIGFFIAIVWGMAAVVGRWRLPRVLVTAASLVAIAALALTARGQALVWQDGLALWRYTVQVMPDNARAQSNLGASLAEAGRFAEAADAYRASLRLDPGNPKVHHNLGLALARLGDEDRAKSEQAEAIRLDPGYSAAHAGLADLLARGDDLGGASEHYREAIRLDETAGLPRINLAMALARSGRLAEAVPHAEAAVRLEPGKADWRIALARLYADLGRRQDALRELQVVLTSSPDNEDAKRELAALR